MRIVAGELKGRTIAAPDGEGTRPTTDRVREALFSSLYSLRGGFEGAVVLDAFAGSGALGIEALSRGAVFAAFVERDARAAAVLERNVRECKLGADRASVLKRDALAGVPRVAAGPFDLVFLDPPYAFDPAKVLGMVRDLREAGTVCEDAIVVYEHGIKDKDAVAQAAEQVGFSVEASKKYGKTGITVMVEAV